MAGLAGLLVAPKSLFAQQASAKIPRVGWIWIGGRAEGNSAEPAGFRQGLKELGYIEGQNITVEYRFGEGRRDRLADLVNELVQLRPDVLVALGDVTVRTVQAATTTIPVVSMTGDPVGVGLVASLARPGGNITGLSNQAADLAAKRLELLREVVPGLRRVAIMANVDYPAVVLEMREVEAAVGTLGLDSVAIEIRRGEDIAPVFGALKERTDALSCLRRPPRSHSPSSH